MAFLIRHRPSGREEARPQRGVAISDAIEQLLGDRDEHRRIAA
jgi:hypothetical protein